MTRSELIRHRVVKALAAGSLLVAAALPLAVASTAGATATSIATATVSFTPTGGSAGAVGAGASGTFSISGATVANDGSSNVSLTTTAPDATFSSLSEGSGTVSGNFATTSSTTPGSYPITLTDDGGTSTTSTSVLTIDADPTVTQISSSSVAQSQNESVTVTGTGFVSGATVSFTNNTNSITLEASTTFSSATSLSVVVYGYNGRTTHSLLRSAPTR